MGVRQRFIAAAVAACAMVCGLPAHALASATQESIVMDDQQLIYASPRHLARTLERLAALGVDRVKVSVVWSLVAPNANSTRRPNFDATDPNAYPPGAWDRYDMLVRLAQQLGLGVYFQLTAPAPQWAVSAQPPTQGYTWSHQPSPRFFGQFTQAVARRYSGSFVAPVPAQQPQPGEVGITPLGGQPPAPGQQARVPRVSYWGIWNEPNEGAWLNPQYRTVSGGRRIYVAPALYRGLVDAAWRSLAATGHTGDTILIGETASGGIIRPLAFVRALYCVDSGYRPLTGRAAGELSCPAQGDPRQFAAAHPGLFDTSGYAHHPYSFDQPPSVPMSDPDEVTLANLGTLEQGLGRTFAAYGRPGPGPPLYLTEWGYKSNPPNPFVHTSLAEQATWINQGEYLAWRDPRVRALAQFLFVDDAPRAGTPRGSRSYWGTFQTGLLNLNGTPKPAYQAFRIPIWVPVARHSSRMVVWGQLRPAAHTGTQRGVVDFRRPGARSWRAIRVVQTANSRGFVLAHVAVPGPGTIRLAWIDPRTGAVDYSRTVAIS